MRTHSFSIRLMELISVEFLEGGGAKIHGTRIAIEGEWTSVSQILYAFYGSAGVYIFACVH